MGHSTGPRIAVAGVLAALWLFIIGAVVYVALLASVLPPLLHEVARADADMQSRLWAVGLEKLAMGGAMAWVGAQLSPKPLLASSVRLGAIAIGIFMLPFVLSVFANFRIPGNAVAIMAAEGSVRLLVAGLIISAVLRRAPA